MSQASDHEPTPVTYVCLPGSPFTGSTLLGFLLNSHPECVSIGAATGLAAKVELSTYSCSCGALFTECPFWKEIAARTRELGRPVTIFKQDFWNTHARVSRNRLINGLLIRSLGNTSLDAARDALTGRFESVGGVLSEARVSTLSLATAVLQATGKTVFVDTARDHQRPKYLAQLPTIDLKVIHLVRDPRGNTASIMKHTGVGVTKAARQWKHYNIEADRVRQLLPSQAWMRLHYENLCADPQGTLDTISSFLRIGSAPIPPNLKATPHHVIGNSMRLADVAKIREDRSWRQRLTAEDLHVIARITGSASHKLGYEWP
jgi:hypothetical protein